jgi:eukaryotic-like serine/threonine-protein kinase
MPHIRDRHQPARRRVRCRNFGHVDAGESAPGQQYLDAPLLLNRYQPLELLARGSTALVFRCRDEVLDRDVAVKHFNGFSVEGVEAFREEVRVLARLNHHGIVAINDAGIDRSSPDEPHPFLVMEYVQGRTLRETLAERQLSMTEIGELAFEVAEALEYVHAQGVIHRDITPSNIMLVNYGTTSSRTRARLTDFGIAIPVGTEQVKGAPTKGTAAYISPEQARSLSLTPAADIYSLGLVILECFTREVAFPGDRVHSAMSRIDARPPIPDAVPDVWRGIIERMTASDPEARPSAAQAAKEIRVTLRTSGRHA